MDGPGYIYNSQVDATGSSVNLGNSTLQITTPNNYTPQLGEVETVISNQTGHAVTGTFNGLPQGAITTVDGVHYQISYAAGSSGQDVTLTVVNVVPNPTVASVMPMDVTSSVRATLSILGADPTAQNDSGLTYTWSVALAPSGAKPVKFSANGTNSAKNATARFQKAGTYQLQCTIANSSGGLVTQSVTITIKQRTTSLHLIPHVQTVATGGQVQYSGVALDQFKHPMPTNAISYVVKTGDGTIDSNGLFTAGDMMGHVVIQITVNDLTGTVGATIV